MFVCNMLMYYYVVIFWISVDVPVLCVEDLQCPLKMKNLCDDYHFMITCCCSG